MPEKMVAVRFFVTESVRDNFKIACIKEKRNMQDVMTELMKNFSKQHG